MLQLKTWSDLVWHTLIWSRSSFLVSCVQHEVLFSNDNTWYINFLTHTHKEKKIKTLGPSHQEEWEVHSDNSASTFYKISKMIIYSSVNYYIWDIYTCRDESIISCVISYIPWYNRLWCILNSPACLSGIIFFSISCVLVEVWERNQRERGGWGKPIQYCKFYLPWVLMFGSNVPL